MVDKFNATVSEFSNSFTAQYAKLTNEVFDAISKIKVQADIDKKIHEATVQINSYQTKLNDNLE